METKIEAARKFLTTKRSPESVTRRPGKVPVDTTEVVYHSPNALTDANRRKLEQLLQHEELYERKHKVAEALTQKYVNQYGRRYINRIQLLVATFVESYKSVTTLEIGILDEEIRRSIHLALP